MSDEDKNSIIMAVHRKIQFLGEGESVHEKTNK